MENNNFKGVKYTFANKVIPKQCLESNDAFFGYLMSGYTDTELTSASGDISIHAEPPCFELTLLERFVLTVPSDAVYENGTLIFNADASELNGITTQIQIQIADPEVEQKILLCLGEPFTITFVP